MARRSDTPSRGEVTEKTDKRRDEMRDVEQQLDVTATDVETIRQTLESLDFGGTAEGAGAVEASIERADDATVEVFDQHDGDLDGRQDETEHHQEDLQARSDTSESDRGKLDDAGAKVETGAGRSELAEARDRANEDIEFLDGQIEQAREAREESERVQHEHQVRVRSKGQ